MKYILSVLFSLIFLRSFSQSKDCNIKIEFTNLEDRKGELIIALFNNESDFLKTPFRHQVIDLSKSSIKSACFDSIPKGKYAFAIIHDLDGNGELNTSIFGPPTEPYGFSNNAMGFMSAPDFESASFDLEGENQVIQSISLR